MIQPDITADIAEAGERRIEWAARSMPVLQAIGGGGGGAAPGAAHARPARQTGRRPSGGGVGGRGPGGGAKPQS
ncbi:hypothetical protein AB0J37_19085, partial [Microbispora rosea]|uniref:hypothetical protein n=1 Tax=Microbispora rosea TaxID=58117 RepID=UPI00344649D7